MRAPLPLILILICLLVAGCGADDESDRAAGAKPAPTPEFKTVAEATARPEPSGRHLTAALTRRTWLHRTPGGRRFKRAGTKTEFGSRAVFSVTDRHDGWLRISTPALPNGRHAWIKESSARLHSTNFSLHVDRSARRLTLRLDGRVVHRMAIAVGRPGNETPLGRFAVTDKLRVQDPSSPYGCCAIALTGHQTKLVPGWVGGDRLAIHGTPVESSVGKEISLGCMRGRRKDLKLLMKRVPLGTPVFVTA